MAFLTHQGSFTTKTNTTGNVAYTGVGFQPKVVIFYWGGVLSDTSGTTFRQGYGAAVSSSSRFAIFGRSTDAAANSDTDRRHDNTKCYVLIGATGVVAREADFVSMDADGFTLSWTTVDSIASVVQYIALAGDDLTNVFIKELQSPTSTGTAAYTGVGFQPDCIIPFTITSSAAPPDSATGNRIGVGFGLSSSARSAASIGMDEAAASSNVAHSQVLDHVIHVVLGSGAIGMSADLDSMDADGFTLDWTVVFGVQTYVWAVCLKGGSYSTGEFSQHTTTGLQATTGVGILPRGLMLTSTNDATDSAGEAQANLSFGTASGVGQQGVIWAGEVDAQANMVSDEAGNRSAVMMMMTAGTPTTEAVGVLSSFDGDGFTINWTTADATARKILYLAFGDTTQPVPTLPPRHLVRSGFYKVLRWHWRKADPIPARIMLNSRQPVVPLRNISIVVAALKPVPYTAHMRTMRWFRQRR